MPGPPPGAGAPSGPARLAVLAEGEGAADGPFVRRSKNEGFFSGLDDAAAFAVGDAPAFAPCLCFAAGEAEGDSLGAGEASFFACLCLAGEADGLSAALGAGEASFL